MESRREMDIIAYYLSEFDAKAFETLGFTSQANGFEKIASLFDKGGNYIKEEITFVDFGMNTML